MLKEIHNSLVSLIKQIPVYANATYVREYRNEYEPKAAWLPDFPTCFLRMLKKNPKLVNKSNITVRKQAFFLLYIGLEFSEVGKLYDLLDDIDEKLDGASIPVTGLGTFTAFTGELAYYGKEKKVWIFTLELTVF
jgi:hypothetical protein